MKKTHAHSVRAGKPKDVFLQKTTCLPEEVAEEQQTRTEWSRVYWSGVRRRRGQE